MQMWNDMACVCENQKPPREGISLLPPKKAATLVAAKATPYRELHHLSTHDLIERNPPPRGGFLFTMFPHQEPCVRGPCKRTPLEEPGTNPSRGVLLHTVFGKGT